MTDPHLDPEVLLIPLRKIVESCSRLQAPHNASEVKSLIHDRKVHEHRVLEYSLKTSKCSEMYAWRVGVQIAFGQVATMKSFSENQRSRSGP